MKKLISLILAVCMVCMMGIAAAEDDIAGDWYADYFSMAMKLTINADGTISMYLNDNQIGQGTWTLDGEKFTITADDESVTEGTYADGVLTLMQEETPVVFGREPIEGIKLAGVKADAAAEEFEGTWKVQYMDMFGMLVDAETALKSSGDQVLPVLTVENGKFTFTSEEEGKENMMSMYANEPFEMAYADGAMTSQYSLGELTITFKCVILEDGMLGFAIYLGEEEGMSFYFAKAAE